MKKRGKEKNGSRISAVKTWHATGSSKVVIKSFGVEIIKIDCAQFWGEKTKPNM